MASINWHAVEAQRIESAQAHGLHAANLANKGDALMAYYAAMQAAHLAFMACPELHLDLAGR